MQTVCGRRSTQIRQSALLLRRVCCSAMHAALPHSLWVFRYGWFFPSGGQSTPAPKFPEYLVDGARTGGPIWANIVYKSLESRTAEPVCVPSAKSCPLRLSGGECLATYFYNRHRPCFPTAANSRAEPSSSVYLDRVAVVGSGAEATKPQTQALGGLAL